MISESLDKLFADALPLVLRTLFGVTIVLCMAALSSAICRRSSAALRHRIWSLGLLSALLLPLIVVAAPAWSFGLWSIDLLPGVSATVSDRHTTGSASVPASRPIAPPAEQALLLNAEIDMPVETLPVTGSERIAEERGNPPGSDNRTFHTGLVAETDFLHSTKGTPRAILFWLSVIWISGVVLALGRIIRSDWKARQAIALSYPISDSSCCRLLEHLADQLALSRRPRLLETDKLTSPACFGFRRTAIMLPVGWSEWAEEELRSVLRHELGHVRRGDVAWQFLAGITCSLYWFHPLAWLAAWRMRIEREYACDDLVINSGEPSSTYARLLLTLANRLSRQERNHGACAVGMARRPNVESRIQSVLQKNRNRNGVSPREVWITFLAAMVMVVFASVMNPLYSSPNNGSVVDDGRHQAAKSPTGPEESESEHSSSETNQADSPRKVEHTPEKQPSDLSDEIMKSSGWEIHTIIHPAHRQGLWEVAFSPDGKIIASAAADKTVKLWDVSTGELLETIERPVNCTGVAFSPDGALLAITGGDHGKNPPGEVVLWNFSKRHVQSVLENHQSAKYSKSVAFSPDGRWLASGGTDTHVKLWNVRTGELHRELTGHSALVHEVAFSPDGRTLASGSFDKTVKLWSMPDGEAIATLIGHEEEVRSVAFSPDGKWLVSTSHDETCRVWDLETQKTIGVMDGHSKWVLSVAFAPDGRHVATGGNGNVVRIWDAATQGWRDSRVFPTQSSGIISLDFSPDGNFLAVAGGWNSFQIWKRRERVTDPAYRRHSNE